MSHKNIIIAPCGNKSTLFSTEWLKRKELKEFDVCLLFYHEEIKNPDLYKDVEYFFHLKDFKYWMIHDLLTKQAPELLTKYEYFYFLDDDIAIDTEGINKMFLLSKAFDTWISQASLSHDSYSNWPVLVNQPDCFMRYVGQLEVMAPLFNRYALIKCLPSFTGNKSSWGIDSVWSKLLGSPTTKIAVFDSVIMKHTQPVGGGELYVKLQIDPYVEWQQVTQQYNATAVNYNEVGRLQIMNANTNRVFFKLNHLNIKVQKVMKHISKGDLIFSVVSYLKAKRRHKAYNLTTKD